jgi:hypothetical protein
LAANPDFRSGPDNLTAGICVQKNEIGKECPIEKNSTSSPEISMLRNCIKVVVRNILRHAGYSFINIAGLAIGMACCLLIML